MVFYNDLPNNTKLNYIHVDNCEFNWFGKGGLSIGGGNGGSGYNDIRITNVVANNNLDSGIFLYAAQPNVHTNVYIAHVKSYNNTGYNYSSSVGVTGHGSHWGALMARRSNTPRRTTTAPSATAERGSGLTIPTACSSSTTNRITITPP